MINSTQSMLYFNYFRIENFRLFILIDSVWSGKLSMTQNIVLTCRYWTANWEDSWTRCLHTGGTQNVSCTLYSMYMTMLRTYLLFKILFSCENKDTLYGVRNLICAKYKSEGTISPVKCDLHNDVTRLKHKRTPHSVHTPRVIWFASLIGNLHYFFWNIHVQLYKLCPIPCIPPKLHYG